LYRNDWTDRVHFGTEASFYLPINQSINIRSLWHDKMQANNSKQKGNTVSKKKAGLEKNNDKNCS